MGINILEEVMEFEYRSTPPKNDICYGVSISKDLVPTAQILFQLHLSPSGVCFRCDVHMKHQSMHFGHAVFSKMYI